VKQRATGRRQSLAEWLGRAAPAVSAELEVRQPPDGGDSAGRREMHSPGLERWTPPDLLSVLLPTPRRAKGVCGRPLAASACARSGL